ncbi:MAG: hypothetical protein L3K24_06340 [Gammaproteobacteria bacterium]|nr:hypothetical protein [Gammaproteobacteria bacterium]
MKKRFWLLGLFLAVLVVAAGVLLIPNPVGQQVLAEAKSMGYLPYSPEEATTLAYSRCTTCHEAGKILQYCSRCGPPFVVVSHSMRKYIELNNLESETIKNFTDAELIAITQVWNALIGNWESNWRQKDIKRLLQNDHALIRFAETPLEGRPIEAALMHKSAPGSYKEIHGFGR